MQVRRATSEDAAALAVVHVRWQAAYRGLMPQDYLDSLDLARREAGWQRWLGETRSSAAVLAWEDGSGAVAGFVNVASSRDHDADPRRVGEVSAIYLLPEHWGRGAGRQLLEAGVAHLADIGCTEATLWVLESNRRARRFYEAGGWRPDGAVRTDESLGFPLDEVRYRRRQGLRPTGH